MNHARDTGARAWKVAGGEAGANYERVRMGCQSGDQKKAEYRRGNAKARVPSLVTDRGVLTETPAILAFIAQSFPAAALAPVDDPFEFGRAQAFNSYLCSTVHVAHAHRMRGYRWADDEAAIGAMQKKVPQSVGECFGLIEREMLAGPWVMGDAYTICDAYLFTLAQWLEADGVDLAKIPRVMDHRRRVAERPAAKRAIEVETGRAV